MMQRARLTAALLAWSAGSAVAQFNLGGGFTSDKCDFASFQTRVAQIDGACCQGKGDDVCPAGTPLACDIECALKYIPFFDECENMIKLLGNAPTPTIVVVGSSSSNSISVPVASVTSCENAPANPQNKGWADTFEVSAEGESITVTRVDCADHQCGWGQKLELNCVAAGSLESLQQLFNMCEHADVRQAIDIIEDLLGHCPLVSMDCTADGCRGGPPVQCAAGEQTSLDGESTLAEVITIGEEVSYQGVCLNGVDGGGWTYVAEEGRSTTDLTDVFPEELGGYHQYVYDTKGMEFNQVLVHRTSPTWCDSWGHTGGWFGVVGKNDVSMGVVMGRDAYCYFNGERNYNWYSVPYCTRNTGSAAPGADCPGAQGLPYAGFIWVAADPNAAGDGDACTDLVVQNVCGDGATLCATADACTTCGADGSWTVVSTADPASLREYLEVENLDAWLQDAGGCDGASTESGSLPVGNLGQGVACADDATGSGYLMYSEVNTHERWSAAPVHSASAEHFVCVVWQPRPSSEALMQCPPGQVTYGDGSACRGESGEPCALWGNAALARCPDEGGNWYYDNNDDGVHAFTPANTDVLVAAVDFGAATVTPATGQQSTVHGMAMGFKSGDLTFTAGLYNGQSNPGEFSVAGTSFVPNNSASGVTYEVFVRDASKVAGATQWSRGGGGGGGH